MEIKEQSENRLVIENSFVRYIFSPQLMIGLLVFFLWIFIFSFNSPNIENFFFKGFILFIVAPVIFIGWAVITGDMIFGCTFDRQKEIIFAQTRVLWQLFTPHTTKINFQDVKGLLISKVGKGDPKLDLQLKSASIRFAGEGDSEVAESIADFLGVPLYIELDNERVTRLPKTLTDDDVRVTVTYCSKCGAPLPRISPGQKNIRCTHCGMTMFLEWNEKLTSFQAKIEN